MNRITLIIRLPFIVALPIILFVSIFSKRGVLDWRRMNKEIDSMQKRIELAIVEKQALERKIKSFESSAEEQERVIREQLGFVKPYEYVIEYH